MRTRRLIIAGTLAAGLALAGCGGSAVVHHAAHHAASAAPAAPTAPALSAPALSARQERRECAALRWRAKPANSGTSVETGLRLAELAVTGRYPVAAAGAYAILSQAVSDQCPGLTWTLGYLPQN